MAYLLVTLNHFRAVQSWAQRAGAQINLDVANFELEIKVRNRVYVLYPQFFAVRDDGFSHTPVLSPAAEGFIGWLPYKPLSWDLASEKLAFKRLLEQRGESTPMSWLDAGHVPEDFLLKRSRGSFGYDLFGPYAAGTNLASVKAVAGAGRYPESTLFAEQFVAGENLKIWFWGVRPFYAHLHPYPVIEGDGQSSVAALIDRRLSVVQRTFDTSPDMLVTRSVLEYQGIRLDDVLASRQKVWLDYRYGRRYSRDPKSVEEDNALGRLPASAREQIARLGQTLGEEMMRKLSAPVLYSVDGVVDGHGKVWWLEMNSNPVMPPPGYPLMFQDLFGVPATEESPTRTALARGALPSGPRVSQGIASEQPAQLAVAQ